MTGPVRQRGPLGLLSLSYLKYVQKASFPGALVYDRAANYLLPQFCEARDEKVRNNEAMHIPGPAWKSQRLL